MTPWQRHAARQLIDERHREVCRPLGRRSIIAGIASFLSIGEAYARGFFGNGGSGALGPAVPTIVSVFPSSGGFTSGVPSGTVISAISVGMTLGSFTGTLTLTGTDAASFQLSSSTLPSNLETNGILGAGTYNINIVATQTGAIGSPFTQPVVVTGASPGTQLSTLTLVNTSGSTQASGFVSPMFGWVFKKGDVPSGTAPVFKNGTTAQPYSWGCQSYWSDGSLKFASFMLRSTASIAGNGSLAIGVWNGGTAPTTSARTVTEVYNELLQVNIVGYGASLGLAGTWGAWLTNDSNNVEQFVYLDGDAGKVWRFLTHVAATSGGTPHGQLECYHYVAALTNSSNALGGFRYLPCIAQPWYDVNSPAKALRAMTTVNWQHGAGPTTVPLALGLTANTFTTAGSTTNATTATVPDYYSGASGNNFNIPCYLTTTGTLPGGLALDTVYSCRGTKNSKTVQFATSVNYGGSAKTMTSAGTGTHTINPVVWLEHFGRLFMPTVDGTWNFFQGAGSLTAEATVRTQIDQNYWHGDGTNKLSLIPPYDLALVGIATDTTFSYNWTPYGVGALTIERSSGGGTAGRQDLGAMIGFQGVDFLMQSANSERLTRINAFPGVHDLSCLRNSTNRNVVNIRGVAHTGMTQFTTIHWYPDTNSAGSNPGFTAPPVSVNVVQVFDQASNAHTPAFFYWPYLRTGEPQFLDCMIEHAIMGTQQLAVTARNTTGTNPGVYTGIGSLWGGSGGERQVAWGHRDLQTAAAVCPLVMPDGSDLHACLNGMADDSISAMIALGASTAIMGSYAVTNKLWMCYDPGSSALFNNQSFQHQYLQAAVCFAAGARENSDALTWLTNEAAWHAYVVSKFGYYCTTTYFGHMTTNFDLTTLGGKPPITSDVLFGTTTPWTYAYNSASSPNWTMTRASSNGAVLQDGDKFLFNPVQSPIPSPYVADTAYYAINTSGNSCNLTTVAGDPAHIVVPVGSGVINNSTGNAGDNWYVPVTDVAPAVGAENTGYVGSGSYMSWKRAQHLNMTALGVTGLSASITDAGQRSGCTGTNVLFRADVRNAYQDHFGP